MWALKTISYAALYFVLCIASLFNPIFGVVNYMLVYQINPIGTWWGKPLQNTGLRFSFVAAGFLLLGLMLSGRKVPKVRPYFDPWEVGVIALVVLALFSTLIGEEYNQGGAIRIDKFWKMMLFVFIFGRLVTTRRNLHVVLWTIVVGTLYLGREAYMVPPGRYIQGRLDTIGGADFHFSSGVAAHLGAMLPLVGAVFLISKRWWVKLLTLVTAALAFNALVLCRTRSAVVGLAAGCLVAGLFTPRKRRIRIYLILLVCTPVALRLTDTGFWERTRTIIDPTVTTTDLAVIERIKVWKIGLRMIRDHPFGVGVGNFELVVRRTLDDRRSAHSTIISCTAELGIPAGILFMIMVVVGFRKLRRVSRLAEYTTRPVETRCLAYGILIAMVTSLVAGCFTERFYTESFWWILTLPLCLERVAVREAEGAPAEAPILDLEGRGSCTLSALVGWPNASEAGDASEERSHPYVPPSTARG